MSERRVVITGVGAICALGNRATDVWEAARAGRSGARRVTRFDPAHIACKIACEVDFDAAAYFGREAKKLDVFAQYALAAADEAVEHSGLDWEKEDPDRCGVICGSGIGGLNEIEQQHLKMLKRDASRISPHFVPRLMINAMAGQISIADPSKLIEATCATRWLGP